MSSSAKRKVIQRLHDMGFSDADIRSAITECGYHVEQCADWIVNRKPSQKQSSSSSASKPRLFITMEIWHYSVDDNDWVPANIVSITKQLISIIFNGHDFRWLEKESDLYKVSNSKPKPLPRMIQEKKTANNNINGQPNGGNNPSDAIGQQEYTPPKQDETDYYVTFTESVLGLELYSDEDGFNCIVGRCVSTIARQKVTPGSQIVQVNDRWLANYRFEEIRDAVKQAARQPPLAVTFRIEKRLLLNGAKNKPIPNPVVPPQNIPNAYPSASPYNNDPYSQSATSPDMTNNTYSAQQHIGNGNGNGNNMGAPVQNIKSDDQKQNIINNNPNANPNPNPSMEYDEFVDFMGTLPFDLCDKLQIGDHIDHRDDVGRFLLATIVDKDEYKVKIHYEGWNSKWDTWCDYKAETHRFARPRSISRKPNTRFRDLKIRDYVDINPIQRHRGWRVGQIRRMDKYSGQAQIVYKEDGQEFLYWAHLNNPEEIAPFMTKAAETIALQQKIAEFEEHEHEKQKINNDNPNNNINPMGNGSKQPQPPQIIQNDNIQNNGNAPSIDSNEQENPELYQNDNNNPPKDIKQINITVASHQNGNNQPIAQEPEKIYKGKTKSQLLTALNFVAPAASTNVTMNSMQGNVNQNNIHNRGQESHGSLKFQEVHNDHDNNMNMNVNNNNNNNDNTQPPHASPPQNNAMNMNNGNNYEQQPHDNNNNNNIPQQQQQQQQQPPQKGKGHKKALSRALPPALQYKKLPPKPPKKPSKKRKKNISRSRTQPLPDNQARQNQMNPQEQQQHINQLNNGYYNNQYPPNGFNPNQKNVNMNNNGYSNNNNMNPNNNGYNQQQQPQQQQQQPQQGFIPQNGYNQQQQQQQQQPPQQQQFGDISFAPKSFQNQQRPPVTHHIQLGNTTYTSQW